MAEMYSIMGLVMDLYVARIVSFCFPHAVDVSALRICSVLCAFVVVIYMCLLYDRLGLKVSPSIFGWMFMESCFQYTYTGEFIVQRWRKPLPLL